MNLEMFIKSTSLHQDSWPRKHAMWLQIAGLVYAVEFLHEANISHGNIEPSNILTFEDPDLKLQLGGFGSVCVDEEN
jgi:serine/threonine protein kinase